MSYNFVKTTVSFEAAHRLYDVKTYSEECRNNIHGHSYKVTVVVSSESLNNANMVIDFKYLKELIHDSIETKFDHSCILKYNDPLCDPIVKYCEKVHVVDDNPTAEWMCKYFYNILQECLHDNGIYDAMIYEVAVQETENNIAIYRGEI